MAWAKLIITDGTKANTVNLLAKRTGWHVMGWRPSIIQYKDGGVWSDNAMEHGRRLAMRRFANATESMGMVLVGSNFDLAVADLRKLRQLFEKAADYWEYAFENTPIYVEARAANETNSRYAVIYAGSVPEDADVVDPTYIRKSIAAGLPLTFEHAAWQDVAPGNSTCVQVSAQSNGYLSTVVEASPVASLDDVCATALNFYDLAAQTFGDIGGDSFSSAVRFASVNVPKNATIRRAYVELDAEGASATVVCNANIDGEDADDPSIFSDIVDYAARVRTTAIVAWSAIDAWVDGTKYTTPDIKTVIQEIVNRAGWVSGNHIVIFIDDNASDADAHRHYTSVTGTYTPAKLVIEYTYAATAIGRAATCLNEVLVANKHNSGYLTDVYAYDTSLGTFSTNLSGTFPVTFTTNPPANGDITYFGSIYGPFSSIVYDILTAQAGCTLVWEYWDGGAWTSFTPSRDNTNAWQTLGVTSIHWNHPGTLVGWATTAINGVTAWWVRAVITTGGGGTAPVQQNRAFYTVVVPYLDIDEAQIGGDLQAYLRLKAYNQSGNNAVAGTPYTNRILLGARSASRGLNFTAYLNASDVQAQTGITVSPVGGAVFATSANSVTGRHVAIANVGSGAFANYLQFSVAAAYAPEYAGVYRAFLRGSGDAVYAKLQVVRGNTIVYTSDPAIFGSAVPFGVADLGYVFISRGTGVLNFELYLKSTLGTEDDVITDLIVFPVDEWIGDMRWSGTGSETGNCCDSVRYIDVDSITQKDNITSTVKTVAADAIVSVWMPVAGDAMNFRPNRDMRLWFLAIKSSQDALVSIVHKAQLYRVNRYFSVRGAT